jgi:hypothetical protein
MHLYGRTGRTEVAAAPAAGTPRTAPRTRPAEPPLAVKPTPAVSDEIVFIRGNQKSVEVVAKKSLSPDGKE